MYVYIRTEPGLWTVGFYGPNKKWNPESDHESTKAAAERVHYLNGSRTATDPDPAQADYLHIKQQWGNRP